MSLKIEEPSFDLKDIYDLEDNNYRYFKETFLDSKSNELKNKQI
jgi:hypothetical protein